MVTLEEGKEMVKSPEFPCAYANAWMEVVSYALKEQHVKLWSSEQLHVLQTIQSLSFQPLRLFGRLLLRKVTWIRPESLSDYMKVFRRVAIDTNTDTEETLEINTKDQLREALSIAIHDLLKVDLIQTVSSKSTFEEAWEMATIMLTMEDWQQFHKKLFSIKLTKTSSKEELLASVRKMILSQRTCFGVSLKDQFVKTLLKYFQEKDGYLCAPIRIPLETVILIRRVVRFFHITATIPSSSGITSVSQPIEAFAPLMATFKIVTYPNYQMISNSADRNDSVNSLFAEQKLFHQWEAAVELLYIFESLNHLKLEEEKLSTVEKMLKQIQISLAGIPQYFECHEFTTKLTSESWNLSDLTTHITLCEITEDIAQATIDYWIMKISIISILSFLSFLLQEIKRLHHGSNNTAESSKQLRFLYDQSRMDYLIRYHPATQLVYIIQEVAAILEKEQFKEYSIAILLYELLLLTPFVEYRRGKWYKRLCIDYEHMKMTSEALLVCKRGLNDSSILISDEIDLRDRMKTLQRKLSNQKLRKSSSKSKKEIDEIIELETQDGNDGNKSSNISSNFSQLVELLNSKAVVKCDENYVENMERKTIAIMCTLMHHLMPLIPSPPCSLKEELKSKESNSPKTNSLLQVSNSAIEIDLEEVVIESDIIKSKVTVKSQINTPTTSKNKTWTCSICTFINPKKVLLTKFSKHICNMCNSSYSEEELTITLQENSSSIVLSKSTSTSLVGEKKAEKKNVNPLASKKGMKEVIDLLDSSDDDHDAKKETMQISSNSINDNLSAAKTAPNVMVESIATIWNYNSTLRSVQSQLQESVNSLSNSQQLGTVDSDDILSSCIKQFNTEYYCTKSLIEESKRNIILKSFTIHGRRFGDPKRKGKNKFCGLNDELLFVEELVMQKCQYFDHDESHHSHNLLNNANGSDKEAEQEEDNCELYLLEDNSVPLQQTKVELQEIKAFKSIHYQEVIDESGGWQGWHCEGSILRTLFGILMWDVIFAPVNDVFLTAYQDAPLDFPYPSFYKTREDIVLERVSFLRDASDEELMQEVARVFYDHKDQCCRLVQWSTYSLKSLQLAALCLGGKALSALFLAMSLNFKQFSSGAPDLFLVHVRAKLTFDDSSINYVNIPLEWLLGLDWNARKRNQKSGMDEDDLLNVPTVSTNANNGKAGGNKRGRWNRESSESINLEENEEEVSSVKKPKFNNDDENDMDKDEGIQHPDEADNPNDNNGAEFNIIRDEGLLLPDYASILRIKRSASFDPTIMQEDSETEPLITLDEKTPKIEFEFKSMSVEVKGPSDHLAYKQLYWLQLLSLPFLDRHQAYVCHVKEEH